MVTLWSKLWTPKVSWKFIGWLENVLDVLCKHVLCEVLKNTIGECSLDKLYNHIKWFLGKFQIGHHTNLFFERNQDIKNLCSSWNNLELLQFDKYQTQARTYSSASNRTSVVFKEYLVVFLSHVFHICF